MKRGGGESLLPARIRGGKVGALGRREGEGGAAVP